MVYINTSNFRLLDFLGSKNPKITKSSLVCQLVSRERTINSNGIPAVPTGPINVSKKDSRLNGSSNYQREARTQNYRWEIQQSSTVGIVGWVILDWLVVEQTPLKNMKVSWDDEIPN